MLKNKFKKMSFLLATGLLLLAGCGENNQDSDGSTINVGATVVPHSEILNFIKDDLAEQGVELIVTEFTEYTMLNTALNDGQIDANFFQHVPFLENYTEISGHDLVYVAKIHVEPMGVYSTRLNSIDELPDGADVTIPNDDTNRGRALLLLEGLGLITLREGVGFLATPFDIVENPKNLVFSELSAGMLPQTLEDVYISVINTNYALEANLDPIEDAIAIEPKDSDYANVLVVRAEDADSDLVQKLVDALTSESVRNFIEEQYSGAIVPSF